MSIDGSFTSTPPSTPPPPGSSSSCERPSPSTLRRGISSSTATRSSAQPWSGSSSRWARSRAVSAYRSPWQNPVAERWIGGCRRELFDHVVVFNERHAVRLARAYIGYFHEDRTHLGLGKDTPSGPARDTATVADREGRGDASCRRTPPPVRVARGRLNARISARLLLRGLPRGMRALPWPAPARLHRTRGSLTTSTLAEYLRRRCGRPPLKNEPPAMTQSADEY